jgi:pyrroline-5-carboxylate reductase
VTDRIGLIGAGNMGKALIQGLIESQTRQPEQIMVNDRDYGRMQSLEREWGVKACHDKAELVREGRILVLACKPKDASGVAGELRGYLDARHLVISVLAGMTLAWLQGALGTNVRVIRAMPNTSAAISASATALAAGAHVTEADLAEAKRIFAAVGQVVTVPEAFMNAVTGLSGSGPAYVYRFVEALTEAGVTCGLNKELALELTVQTLVGAVGMLRQNKCASELRLAVTSPGGTTEAGLRALEEGGFREAILQAVRCATERAAELSAELSRCVDNSSGAGI